MKYIIIWLICSQHVFHHFSVEKTKDFQIQVVTKIYQVITFDSNHSELFPKKNKGIVPYSFAYIAVNPKTRTVAIFHHNVGDTIYT